VTEEEKCIVKTYQDAVKSLMELQESALQQNNSDIVSVISQAKVCVCVEIRTAKRVNCVHNTLLKFGYNYEKGVLQFSAVQ
jgi:hypothetical protein